MIKYRIGRLGEDTWTPALSRRKALRILKQRAAQYLPPYRIKERGDNKWGPNLGLRAVIKRMKIRLEDGRIGDIFFLDTTTFKRTLKIRIVEVGPSIVPSDGTPRVKTFHEAIFSQYSELESWGICNCRRIDGSNSWSQHAFCNAEDVHGPSMAYMDNVYKWIKRNTKKFGVAHALWRVPNHFDHIHIDFAPQGKGVPSCAK